MASAVAFMAATATLGHGHIVYPPARNNGTFDKAGNCDNYACFWFSQITEIPGEPTLPDEARTYNVKVNSGDDDWSRQMPWRAPGTAPVLGSGCGVAGGGPVERDNGGIPPKGYAQGVDFLTIPEQPSTTWKRGSVQEVAWALFANHGGGYSWRLCPKGGNISEACFQKHTLDFVGDKQWLRYATINQWDKQLKLPDFEIDAVRTKTPSGQMWTRNPVPGCMMCDQAQCMKNYSKWIDQQHCSQSCSGLNISGRTCPPGMTQFPEPLSGISGYFSFNCLNMGGGPDGPPMCDGLSGFEFSIVDKVQIPLFIEKGEYLLSWRWDCEQSRQIWQNCADITIE